MCSVSECWICSGPCDSAHIANLLKNSSTPRVACPQSGNPCEYLAWVEGGGRNDSLQYLEFGPQNPFQPLAAHITCCAFNLNRGGMQRSYVNVKDV